MVNISDVARAAGVSGTTVSNVLSGRIRVSEDKRERVLQAVQELGYRPNLLAQGLRNSRSYMIGVVVPDSANPFYAEVLKGINRVARASNLAVLMGDSDYDIQEEAHLVDALVGRRIDGLILVSLDLGQERSKALKALSFPVVLADSTDDGHHPSVGSDNHRGIYEATSHLIKEGYRSIGFLSEPLELPVCRNRYQGFCEALTDFEKTAEPALIKMDPGLTTRKLASAYKAAKEMLSEAMASGVPLPMGLITTSDLIAMGVLRAAAELGLRVPQELGLVGFDDIPGAEFAHPPLTTVRQKMEEMGMAAAHLLLREIDNVVGDASSSRSIILPAQLVIRATSCL